MPINKPSAPVKKSGRPLPQTVGKKSTRARKQPPPPPALSWWEQLSPERRLDVVGVALASIGALILLGLVSANRSVLVGGFIFFLTQLFGWGVYILPIGLLVFGMWLVFRKIERIPPLSVERAAGSVLLFFWLLTLMHVAAASLDASTSLSAAAESVALAGQGGGYLGSLSQTLLWASLGPAAAYVALFAWFILALAMALDISVMDLFRWLGPLVARLRAAFAKRTSLAAPEGGPVPASEYKPIPSPSPPTPRPPLPSPTGRRAGGEGPPNFPPAPVTTIGPPAIQWNLPQVRDILDAGNAPAINDDFIKQRARLIEETLASFGAPAQVVEISRGPTITQFGVEPLFVETRNGRTRVRVSKIASLSDDLALALAAPRIRIQAPVPGHSYVGIEVPNDEMALVSLRDAVESEAFQRSRKPLSFALGQDVAGHPITANLEVMPHLLIAGTTGSGKSVCVNAIITSFLLYNTPDELKLVLIDPKRVELTGYNGIPHLLNPVVVEMERVIGALQWMTREMDKRYHDFSRIGARNITDYNGRMQMQGGKKLPNLVMIIDELADLMMIAPDETERTITRLAQLARATGIHMILATQRPSVDVVTGLIKANFPARVAFAVASGVDSRVILDQPGAERLLGRGDMLYQAPDAASPARLQGVFVSDHEIQKLVEFWRAQVGVSPYAVAGSAMPGEGGVPAGVPLKQQPLWDAVQKTDGDPLYSEAIDIVRREGRASVSMLQRRLRIGYTRAARLMDQMEVKKIVGPPEGATQVRQVLDYGPAAPPKEE
ncbi:MAG TPA: DNA translocase FtsK 4TM domain-containing protein [Anaerolineales bacterium]